MTNCYVCGEKVTEIVEDETGCLDSLGERVLPSADYACVDVILSNGNSMVGYATPVCKTCHKIVMGGHAWNDIMNNVLSMVKKYNFGPPHFIKKAKNFSVVSVKDLTEELKQNGII